MKPLAIELYAGACSWSKGAIATGFRTVAFDIEHLPHHGPVPEGCELVLQDVQTLHGSQFKDASLILCSPPCQKYSWLAMPWSRSKSNNSAAAKALRAKWESEGPDNELFEACFRIQREANAVAKCFRCNGSGVYGCWQHGMPGLDYCPECGGSGHRYIPLIVENVRGAQEWVGAVFYGIDAWKAASREERWRMGRSAWNHGPLHLWGDIPALMPKTQHVKIGGDWFSDPNSTCRKHGSKSSARKAASALIARIPPVLAEHIAQVYYPGRAA